MSNQVTRIHDLPSDPAVGNISLEIKEKEMGGMTLDQSTINQIVSGLQQATSSGVTQLPSRDIPLTTHTINQDPEVQPNYIPKQETQRDYIHEEETNQQIMNKETSRERLEHGLDSVYNEIQFPILIAVLFFLFQLPIFKKLLFQYFPILFFKDGNINLYGLLFMSSTFSIVYYLLFKTLNQLDRF
jgi:hypothetical protein